MYQQWPKTKGFQNILDQHHNYNRDKKYSEHLFTSLPMSSLFQMNLQLPVDICIFFFFNLKMQINTNNNKLVQTNFNKKSFKKNRLVLLCITDLPIPLCNFYRGIMRDRKYVQVQET